MTNHQKRLSVPNSWPVERKTETFTVKADAGPHGEDGVPLLIILRDVLGYVDSKKEARYALGEDGVLVNGAAISDESRPIGMFDIMAFPAREEYYRVFPDEGGRLALTAIDEDSAASRLGKVVGKTQVPGGATQLTLHDGETLHADESSYSPKDSLVIDNESKAIVAHFPYEEGELVTAVDGQHAGQIGRVESIDVTLGSGDNTVVVETDDGTFETIEEYVVVIDENFTDSDSDSASSAAEQPDAEADADGDGDGDGDADADTEDGGDDA